MMRTGRAEHRRAVVVGSGPNGLAAAITLAEAGHSVTLLEAASEIGGGARSAELTLPGFVHDVCSAIYPFGRTSPFMVRHAPQLAAAGLRWVDAPFETGHPLDDGPAVVLTRDLGDTAAQLGADGAAYRRALEPLIDHWHELAPHLLASFNVPFEPLTAMRMARFGWQAIKSADGFAARFGGDRARALFAGVAAHSILPFHERLSAATALMLMAAAHVGGWPMVAGGAGNLARAMGARLLELGGSIETGRSVAQLGDLPEHDVVLFDVMPGALARICGDSLPSGYRQTLRRYRHGAAVFKLDMALDGAIPWRDDRLLSAGTVHLGGTYEEIARSEAQVAAGTIPDRPYVLLAQQSLFDAGRAPQGRHTVWAYCHVPHGSAADMRDAIVSQVERFAPGFRDRILATAASDPAQLERSNANYVGGDISGGRLDLGQLFRRPARPLDPYSTPDRRIYLCSSATPPGPGVHGMAGYHAAISALRRVS